MCASLCFIATAALAFDIATEMRSPTQRGGVAQNIMDSGSGADSMHAVNLALDPQAGDTIVELGPGSGWSLREILKRKPAMVHAVEISEAFRDTINEDEIFQRAQADGLLTVVGDDAVKLGLDDASVDRVFGFNVVYFLNPLTAYLKELLRVMKGGARLVWGVKTAAQEIDPSGTVYVNTVWSEIKREMEQAGFVNVVVMDQEVLDANTGLEYTPIVGHKATTLKEEV